MLGLLGKILIPYLATNELSKWFIESKVYREPDILNLPTATLILPTLNEENYIEKALNSLLLQNINPSLVELIIVDSHSIDNTVGIIKKLLQTKPPKFNVKLMFAPRGLLTARDMAIKEAKNDIVVSVQADIIYPENWLAYMLKHFNNPNVVAVSGVKMRSGLWGWIDGAMSYIFPQFLMLPGTKERIPVLYGNMSAFRRVLYPRVAFNTSIDQLSMREMQEEEEQQFAERLRNFGDVVIDYRLPAYASSRRTGLTGDKDFRKQVKTKVRFGLLGS